MRKLAVQIYDKVKKNISSALLITLFRFHSAYLLSILLVITLFWASFIPSLNFNYDIESFFSLEDPEVEFYDRHQKSFENENDFVLVGIKNNEGIFHKNFLLKIDSLSKNFTQISAIKNIYSPTNLFETIKGPMGSFRIPLLHTSNPKKYASDKKRIYQSDQYLNSFFAQDGKSISILLKKSGELSRKENSVLLVTIKDVLDTYQFDEIHLAGRIQTQDYYMNKMQAQMTLFGVLAFALFVGSLFIIFKCIRYVLISFTTVTISMVWIFGVIGWLGISLDLMLTLLPALIFVISTSGSIHLIARFKKEYSVGVTKKYAIKKSIVGTGMPNFLNAFTTAIGFASLIMIPVLPIQRFGLFTAAGILVSFFISLLIVPAALNSLPIKASQNLPSTAGKGNNSYFIQIAIKKPILISVVSMTLILFSIYFSTQIKINNHFLDDLDPSSSLKKDLDFFETNFSGIRPFELNVQSNANQSVLDYRALQEMDTVEKYLRREYKVGFLFSPLTVIKSINKATHGGKKNYYCLPTSQGNLDKVLKLADKNRVWGQFLSVITDDKLIARISGKTLDEGNQVLAGRNENLRKFLKHNTKLLKFKITGAAQLLDNANANIAWNLMKGILLAIGVTTLLIGLFTRSWKLAAISLVPNLIPLLLVAGFMGATGIPLKVGTSLIFTIAYGIAVDDTIHFLNNYQLNRKIYQNNDEAVMQTISYMWRPMLNTSLVLFSGFMIFSFSEFSSISTLGLLISGSLIAALLTDLTLLPILLTSSASRIYMLVKIKLRLFGRKQLGGRNQSNLQLQDTPKSSENYAVKI